MIVAEIRDLLSSNIPTLCIFEKKLIGVKYITSRKSLYAERFYKRRNERCYRVLADFPRVMENGLRDGASNVVYAISIGVYDEYLVSEGVLFNTIR